MEDDNFNDLTQISSSNKNDKNNFDDNSQNNNFFNIRAYAGTIYNSFSDSAPNGDEDLIYLQQLKPMWIIMYDADMSFVRRIEVIKLDQVDLQSFDKSILKSLFYNI